MTIKEIQELVRFFAKSGVDELSIEKEGFKIGIKKNPVSYNQPQVVYTNIPSIENREQPDRQTLKPKTEITVGSEKQTPTTKAESTIESESKLLTVKSPMIGTFYRSAAPDSPPFVNVGDRVEKGKVICVIEAMKLFNEIECEYTGRVAKILSENASPVEYDQPLMLIEP